MQANRLRRAATACAALLMIAIPVACTDGTTAPLDVAEWAATTATNQPPACPDAGNFLTTNVTYHYHSAACRIFNSSSSTNTPELPEGGMTFQAIAQDPAYKVRWDPTTLAYVTDLPDANGFYPDGIARARQLRCLCDSGEADLISLSQDFYARKQAQGLPDDEATLTALRNTIFTQQTFLYSAMVGALMPVDDYSSYGYSPMPPFEPSVAPSTAPSQNVWTGIGSMSAPQWGTGIK